MKLSVWTLLLAAPMTALFAGSSGARVGPAAPGHEPAGVLEVAAAGARERIPGETYADLLAEFDAAYKAYRVAPRGEGVDPWPVFFPRFHALAEDGQPESMLWVLGALDRVEGLKVDRDDVLERYAVALIDGHSGAEWLGPLAAHIENAAGLDVEAKEGLLRDWLSRGPHADAAAALRYSLGSVLIGSGDDTKRAEGLAVWASLIKDLPEDRYAMRAKGQHFRLTRLQQGMVVPDIATEDVDGVPFKLSDYRGKVVLLDFWGFW